MSYPSFLFAGLFLCAFLLQQTKAEGQTLGAEAFQILPLSQARDYTESVELTARASFPAPVTYQWWKNGTVIEGANTGSLLIGFASSSDSGIYTVRATSGGISAETDCLVQIGPYRGPRSIPEDALLMSTGTGLYQMPENLSGTAAATPSPLPFLPFQITGARIMDSVVDRWGRLHVLTLVLPSRTNTTLSTYYPAFDRWVHRPLAPALFTAMRGQMHLSTFSKSIIMGRRIYDMDSLLSAPILVNGSQPYGLFQVPEWSLDAAVFPPKTPPPPGIARIFGTTNPLNPQLYTGFLNGSLDQPVLLGSLQDFEGGTRLPIRTGAYLPVSTTADSPAAIVLGFITGVLQVGSPVDILNPGPVPATIFQNPLFTPGQQYTDSTPTLSGHVFLSMTQPTAGAAAPHGLVRFNPATGEVRPVPLPETAAEPYSAYSAATRRIQLTEFNPPQQPIRLRDGDLLNVPWAIQAEEDSAPVLVWEPAQVPPWLTVTLKDGYFLLSGTPLKTDTGATTVTGTARHPSGSTIAGRFSVIVDPRNTPPVPVAEDRKFTKPEDSIPLHIALAGLFTDAETAGESLTYSVETLSGSTLATAVTGTTGGQKSLILTPLPDQHGTARFRLTATDPITLRDPAGLSASMLITLELTPVNDRPAAMAATLRTPEDSALAVTLSGMDVDGDSLTFEVTASPEHGTLSGSAPHLIYTPDADFNGTDRFSYTANDGLLKSFPAAINITVDPRPDDPRTFNTLAEVTAPASGSLTFFPAGLFFEPDGETLTYTVTGISHPTIVSGAVPQPNGALVISFTPFSLGGSAILTLRATDPTGRFVERPLTVTLPSPAVPGVRVTQGLKVNRQTGLLELEVIVTNLSTRSIGGFEVRFAGLPSDVYLYNGSDRQNVPAKSVYDLPVEAGQSVTLLYQFYSPSRQTSWTPVLTVNAILPPTMATAGGGIEVDRIVLLPGGGTLLEFPAVPGAFYQIELMDSGQAWTPASTVIRAGGTRVQWMDQGPPSTPALPAGASSRFYRVRAL